MQTITCREAPATKIETLPKNRYPKKVSGTYPPRLATTKRKFKGQVELAVFCPFANTGCEACVVHIARAHTHTHTSMRVQKYKQMAHRKSLIAIHIAPNEVCNSSNNKPPSFSHDAFNLLSLLYMIYKHTLSEPCSPPQSTHPPAS